VAVSISEIWNTNAQSEWNRLFQNYWTLIRVDNIQVEYTLNRLTPDRVAAMDAQAWYVFLHDEYFLWKYTAKNRLATTRAQLRRYFDDDALDQLNDVRLKILRIDFGQIAASIELAGQIRGLGVSGASGLISLIYPEHFATVDQFVVKALREVPEHGAQVAGMDPDSLSLRDGVILTEIMRSKAAGLNAKFGTRFWTPRTLEMALWAYRP
jgi:hypothetical protein